MSKEHLAIFIPGDADPAPVYAKLRTAFGEPLTSISLQPFEHHFLSIVCEGDVVIHTETQQTLTRKELDELLRNDFGFIRMKGKTKNAFR